MWSISWLFVVEAVAIVTGNAISIFIFTSTRRLRSRKYLPIINLAVADLLSGVVTVPLFLYCAEGPQDEYLTTVNTVYKFADTFFGAASIFGLAALAIERAHATYYPFKHNTLSKAAYIIGCAVVWLTALLHALGSHFFSDFGHFLKVVFVIGISLAIVSVSYFLIWIKVTRISHVPVRAMQADNRKLTITLAIVTVISYITMMPLMIMLIYASICGLACLNGVDAYLLRTLMLLHYGNSLVNFIIYSLRMSEFQSELLRRIGCRRHFADDMSYLDNHSKHRSSAEKTTKENFHLVDSSYPRNHHDNHNDGDGQPLQNGTGKHSPIVNDC